MGRSGFLSVALLAAAAARPLLAAEPADSASTALEAELDALFREIGNAQAPAELDPDRAPDLVIASTRAVLGEVAPCG